MANLPTPKPYDNNTEAKNIENQTYGTGNNYRLSEEDIQFVGDFEMIEALEDFTQIKELTGKDANGVEYDAAVHHNIKYVAGVSEIMLNKGEVYRATGKYISITKGTGVVNIIR